MVQKFQPNSLIGHSIGGVASIYYQHHYAHPLKKMVLLGSPSDFKILLSNYVTMLSLKKSIHEALVHYTKDRFNIVIEDFSGQEFLKHSSLEGIIAHDVEDSVVNFSEAKKLAATWKKSTFIETKGFGHSLHDADLYQKISIFLKGA
jgi:predicted alpha/beta hydrolase family esterase